MGSVVVLAYKSAVQVEEVDLSYQVGGETSVVAVEFDGYAAVAAR